MAKFCLVMIEHFSEQFGNYQISIIFCIISFQEFLKCRLKNRILMIKFEVLYLNNCFVVIVNNNVKIEILSGHKFDWSRSMHYKPSADFAIANSIMYMNKSQTLYTIIIGE